MKTLLDGLLPHGVHTLLCIWAGTWDEDHISDLSPLGGNF